MDKAKGGQDQEWEVGMGGVGGCERGEMEITVLWGEKRAREINK